MKVPRLKIENLMALDVADAGVLKRDVVRLLLQQPQGIKYGDFSGAFYKLHGHHPQLVVHGYSSLKYLLTDMKNMVVLEKYSQATVIKLANGVPFNQWLDDREGWDSSEKEIQSPRNEKAEDEAEPCSPAPFLDPGFTVPDSILQKMEQKTFLATAVVPIFRILRDYPKGLDLRMLTETLKKRGFDLERLSQDVGYSDTIHCLLEMPRLRLTFCNGLVPQNCVVQLLSSSPRLSALPFTPRSSLHKPLSSSASSTFPQPASQSSTTSQASASPSCDSLRKSKTWAQIVLGKKPASRNSTTSQSSASFSCHSECSANKSKTQKQSVPRKKAASAEVLELLTNLINTYTLGVTIKELQEFLLRVMGFDLEKFSIAQGYKDTLEFLEDQMPELQVKYSKKRLQCVVKQGEGIRKEQKKCQRGRKKLAKSPEESLALLTNLLKSGMKIKKLQELLLALAGFDMEKFCIAQGYVDTLGYLEHQMPELKITYCGNRLDCVVKQGQGKRKKQKKGQGSREETINTWAEVLVLLTKLLKTYTSGLRVKKLQEFVLAVKGFDLQKFTIAKSYKDILEFLEHQMPQPNITYCGNRLECVFQKGQGKRREQKMCHGSREEMTETLAEVLVFLTNLLKTFKSRLRVKKLQEFLLTVKGFDLQKFNIAEGYKDTLEFLEHEMPELNITYCGNRLECVIKKGQGKKKEQKTCQVSQEEMTQTLAEVLALLTMLLKTYTSRLWVKKLQKFLLAVKGFDLQKFTINQGYKDTVEFLEHQMPELNITSCGNRLECIFKKGQGKRKEQKMCQGSQEEMTETLAEVLAFLTKLLKTLRPRVKKLQEFLLTVEDFDLQKLTTAQNYKDILEFLEHQMPELKITYCGNRLECVVKKGQGKRKEQKTCQSSQEKTTKKTQDSQIEIAEQTIEILETQSRSNNLLFRGISEDFGRQNLEERFRELLQDYLKIQGDFPNIDQISRVNPGFKNKLPRDILVRFTRKKTRDEILKKHKESPFKVTEKEVQIFQDLPTSVLRKRKNFDFLRQILQEKKIRYHWKIPFAIEVCLPKERKVIKTEEQAKLLAEELQAEELKKNSSSKP